jgi:dolichyl-phosphate-mannose-protein mannosyltransferase
LERELYSHELIPQKPTYLSFWEKFSELQLKMLLTNQENVQNHNYASDPLEWPLLTRGIAYYISKESNVSLEYWV